MKKRVITPIVACALTVCMCVPVFATESSDMLNGPATINLDVNDAMESENFQVMTRTEYISELASSKNITYEQAEKIVDSDIAEAKSSMPNTLAWQGDTMHDNGDTTTTVYGRVYADYQHPSGMSLRYSVQAVLLRTHYGAQWISCNSSGTIIPGSGRYTFSGNCTASIIATRQLRLVVEGYFEIASSVAESIGVDIDVLNYSYSVGWTQYYRGEVYKTHIENV